MIWLPPTIERVPCQATSKIGSKKVEGFHETKLVHRHILDVHLVGESEADNGQVEASERRSLGDPGLGGHTWHLAAGGSTSGQCHV